MKTRLFFCLLILVENIGFSQIKSISPKLGNTPDISINGKLSLEKNKILLIKVDSIVRSYGGFEKAKKHLSKQQMFIYENDAFLENEDYLFVGDFGCSWYCGGGPDSIYATSALKPLNKINYEADNAHDFSLRTAWVVTDSMKGIGQSISYRFQKLSAPVTKVQIYNGYMKSVKAWKENSRVKTIKMYLNKKPYLILNLKDTTSLQIFDIGSLQGVKKDMILKFEILEVYKGDKYNDVAISEIEFDGTGVHCFAKGTLISQPDGHSISVENLKSGDVISSFNSETNTIEKSTVLEIIKEKHHNLYELNFEGTIVKTTDDHPFFNNGKFYSIKENTSYGFISLKIKIGQKITTNINGETKRLTEFKKMKECEETYTITKMNKNHLFFANGLCVATEDVNMVLITTD